MIYAIVACAVLCVLGVFASVYTHVRRQRDMARMLIGSGFTGQQLVVLSLLSEGPMYGLDLAKRSGGAISRGMIYVVLSRMADDGWVVPECDDNRMLTRSLYRLTPYGEVAVAKLGLGAKAVHS